MKRWLITALLALAVLVFLAPGLIGLLAERSIDRQLELSEEYGQPGDVRALAFERGWFTSAGQHRLALADPDVARLLAGLTPGAGVPDGATALIIDTRFDHGVIPVSAITGDNGTPLLPALATGVSTLSLELPDGSLLPVPGTLYSRVGLTGSLALRYLLPAGDEARGQARAAWQAAEFSFGINNDGSEMSVQADMGSWRFENSWQAMQISSASVAIDGESTAAGIVVGDASLSVANYASNFGEHSSSLNNLAVHASSSLEHDALNAVLHFQLLGLDTVEGPIDVELSLDTSGLQSAVLAPILRRVQYSLQQGQANGSEIYPGFEVDLRRLLSSGAALNVDNLQVRTKAGDAVANVNLELPALDEVASWPGLLLELDAAVEIQIDRNRANAESEVRQTLQRSIASGFLVPDGDVYRMQVDYAKGRATVNGAPLQITPDMFQ